MDSDTYPFLQEVAELFSNVQLHAPTVGAIVAIVLAALLLGASGFVSASEIAFFSLKPADLSKIAEEEHPSDLRIKTLLADSERLLATILISNNFVNVTIIMLCNYFFATVIDFGTAEVLEFLCITVILTSLLLLFGEIMPKIYSSQYSLPFARRAAPVLSFLCSLFSPLSKALVKSTFFVNKMMQRQENSISIDELSQALELTDKEEIKEESTMLEGIIRFGEETVREVMTARVDMVCLGIDTPFSEVLNCVVENAYSRIPVYGETRDDIRGVLYVKDLLPYLRKRYEHFNWAKLIRPAYFVPETKMLDDLLREFQLQKMHIAIVVDEFGGTSGIVTMEDIIEEIVGEINDEYDSEELPYMQLDDHTFVFEGKTLLTDMYKVLQIDDETFEKIEGDADTLAGMLLEMKGEFPALHEVFKFEDYRFEVLEMEKKRITKVKVTLPVPA